MIRIVVCPGVYLVSLDPEIEPGMRREELFRTEFGSQAAIPCLQ
jgi:hypothetical protein